LSRIARARGGEGVGGREGGRAPERERRECSKDRDRREGRGAGRGMCVWGDGGRASPWPIRVVPAAAACRSSRRTPCDHEHGFSQSPSRFIRVAFIRLAFIRVGFTQSPPVSSSPSTSIPPPFPARLLDHSEHSRESNRGRREEWAEACGAETARERDIERGRKRWK
jgi:hypothetical protein